jgi:hypothetical protein
MALLAGFALAACGSPAAASSAAAPTPTCPSAPQFQQVVGTITAVNSTQMTVQTTKGETLVNLTSRTRYTHQETTTQSDVQDGTRVQVVVKPNGDGTYTAQLVALRQAVPNGGNGGNGGSGGGNRGGNGNGGGNRGGTPVPARCRTGRGGTGGGFGGTGTTIEGGIPTGDLVLNGTVATINGQSMTVTEANGTDYNVKLDSTTVYSRIATAQASDLKTGQAVLAIGQKASNGSINALAVTILLALPTSQ